VNNSLSSDPPAVRAVALLHQEGVLGLIAIIGIAVRTHGSFGSLAATVSLHWSILLGVAAGVGSSGLLWLIRNCAPLRELQQFQQRLVGHWTRSDAASVALLSGIAEEALLRALLQPLLGLVPAAVIFAVLHLVPDRRLWLWPVVAFALGLMLGLLYETAGYPAAAAAHIVINLCALLRLRRLTLDPSHGQ